MGQRWSIMFFWVIVSVFFVSAAWYSRPLIIGESVCSLTITVDYGLSFRDMVAAGKYDLVDPYINPTNFPFERKRKVEKVKIEFYRPGRMTQSPEVLIELIKRGLRAATLPELLALGAQCPALQQEDEIVALGSVWDVGDGRRFIPKLWGVSSRRELLVTTDDWMAAWALFAAVRK